MASKKPPEPDKLAALLFKVTVIGCVVHAIGTFVVIMTMAG